MLLFFFCSCRVSVYRVGTARTGYTEIGNLVGISRAAVKNRMDQMQEAGGIKELSFQTVSSVTCKVKGASGMFKVSVKL